MRGLAIVVMGVALAACGQPSGATDAAAAQGAGGGEAAFVDACVGRYTAQSAQARQWAPAQCAQEWTNVVAAAPIAEAILAAVDGTTPRAGRMGSNIDVTVEGRTVSFGWEAVGEMIPYDAVGALAQRGATPTMIGCAQVGVGEFSKVYSVVSEGRAPFQLSIYERTAPTGDAWSIYAASVDLSGRVQTLAQLARDGGDWATACPY
ncbi:MAG: hypothetical protein J0L81_12410 [Caulobacterales bacterium]|jgi:hypothetical protein|nr:hypothetical protein [Caulobacterales bacterium]